MKHSQIIGLLGIGILCSILSGCRTVKTTSESVVVASSARVDSVSYRETVKPDTVTVKTDTVRLFIPYERLMHDTVMADPAPMVIRSGRASVSVIRLAKGIMIKGQCDSVQAILLNKTIEVYNLKTEQKKLESVLRQEKEKIRIPYPVQFFITLLISLIVNALFIIRKCKNIIK